MAESGASPPEHDEQTRERGDERAAERREVPSSPAKLGASGWLGAVRRSMREFGQDNLQDWAAA